FVYRLFLPFQITPVSKVIETLETKSFLNGTYSLSGILPATIALVSSERNSILSMIKISAFSAVLPPSRAFDVLKRYSRLHDRRSFTKLSTLHGSFKKRGTIFLNLLSLNTKARNGVFSFFLGLY